MTDSPTLRIGLISQWPEIKNAEYELLEKVRRTEGYTFYLIDYLGHDLATGRILDYHDLDFAIAFHHDTPKYVNCPTYCAVINPLEYPFLSQDYAARPAMNYMNHDEHVIAKSATFLRYHLNNILGRDSDYADYPEFYPSVSRNDVCIPCTSFPHIFYCGMNWERLSDTKGRHDDLLTRLDHKGFMQLHGPSLFLGKELWNGFKSYMGEIPFDGISILEEINKCGVSLVLSSDVHFANETTSCRIYESCAAGAVIITDENPFIVREFGDSVLYFKRTGDATKDAKQIEKQFQWIQQNPDKAAELAKKSQRIFLEKFSLEFVMAQIADHYRGKQSHIRTSAPPSCLVTVALRVLQENCNGLEEAIESIKDQNYSNLEIIVQCLPELADFIQRKFDGFTAPVTIQTLEDFHEGRRTSRKGKYLAALIDVMKGDYLALIEPGWKWNYDHLTTLVATSGNESALAISGCYQFVDVPAPLDPCTIKRFCNEPRVSDFEKNGLFVDLPSFLVPRRLLQPVTRLSLLFEHYEALLVFIQASMTQTKTIYSSKITAVRLHNSEIKISKDSSLSFWGKVSSKLDNPDYEFKILYDRIRFHPSVDIEIKDWIGSKAGVQNIPFGKYSRNDDMEFLNIAKAWKKHAPREYYFARILYRIYRLIVRCIPIHARS